MGDNMDVFAQVGGVEHIMSIATEASVQQLKADIGACYGLQTSCFEVRAEGSNQAWDSDDLLSEVARTSPLHVTVDMDTTGVARHQLALAGITVQGDTEEDMCEEFEVALVTEVDKSCGLDTVRLLLQAGAGAGCRRFVESGRPHTHGTSALHRAAVNGLLQHISLLIDSGANPNDLHQGDTALSLAAQNAHLDVVQMLIERGACPNRRGALGLTPLHAAAVSGDVRVLECLLRAGADLVPLDHFFRTPAKMAQMRGDEDAVSFLKLWGEHTGVVDYTILPPPSAGAQEGIDV